MGLYNMISLKKVSDQKNSIFVKILLPTVAVMLFQVILIALVLVINGTFGSLEKNAQNTLYRNAENRSITLENMMVHTWSNIDKLEADVAAVIETYQIENRLPLNVALNARTHQNAILALISNELIHTMRMTSTTGTFMFFLNDDALNAQAASLNGLYYRDFNPNMTSADYSDVLLEKGSADFARDNNIQLASLWSELYTVDASNEKTWDALFSPYVKAKENPGMPTKDLAMWSDAHYLDPLSKLDSNQMITYVRPIMYHSKPIGVVGIEVQVDHLKRFFPAEDIGDLGGYMLVRYNTNPKIDVDRLTCFVNVTDGSYIKRLADFSDTLTLSKTNEEHIYTSRTDSFDPTTAALQSLKLYNTNAPFGDQTWALVALQTDEMLYGNATRMKNGIMQSAIISLIFGGALIVLSVRYATKPLLSIASQIEHGHADAPVVIKNANTYEVLLLRDTINEMKRKRQDIETALREERERYLLALESAIDVFIEYDIPKDLFLMYLFESGGQMMQLTSMSIQDFKKNAEYERIFHPADAQEFMDILCGDSVKPCEVRIRADLLSQREDSVSDDGYHWFSFKAVQIAVEDGTIEKVIGSATQITGKKLEEFERLEATHHDITTGLYNRDYGELLATRLYDTAIAEKTTCSMMAIIFSNFEQFEAYYGQVFSAVMLREICHSLDVLITDQDAMIRWSNDELVVFCEKSRVDAFLQDMREVIEQAYTGENNELKLDVRIGIAPCGLDRNVETCLSKAFAAADAASVNQTLTYDSAIMGTDIPDAFMRRRTDLIAVDVSKDSIIGFTLNLLEHTRDMKSVMNMLIQILGELYGLDQILICEYDQDFGANQVIYQWGDGTITRHASGIEKTTHKDFTDLVELLGDKGILHYNSGMVQQFSTGVQKLLCVPPELDFAALCCAMYEKGMHTGRALFVTAETDRVPTDAETFSLSEVTKIMSTLFSLERSNSASKAKSEFLSKMSHEIRTPMNAIIGMTRIAKEAGHDYNKIEDCLDKVDFSAKHLLSLINDILDMSRIESGKLTIEKMGFSLTELAENIDALMREQFEIKGIAFDIKQSVNAPYVVGDEQKLRQVLINLLGNACKFTPKGGSVTLDISEKKSKDADKGNYTFSVSDTGVGISEGDRYRIFNAFEQSGASNAAAGNPQGTGLGLAISSSLVGAMGGKIQLDSEIGQGSTFYFSLVLPKDNAQFGDHAAASSTSEKMSHDRFKGKRVLLVDDNELNLEIASFMVENIGFSVETAVNGQEAVDMFFEHAPGYYDIIFMDINMPILNGLDATREIRKNKKRPDARNIPIIAMTANAFSDDTKKSIESGMNAHIAKPIEPEYLYQTLDKLLKP